MDDLITNWKQPRWKDFNPKYGFCLTCREFFKWDVKYGFSNEVHHLCPNKYHNANYSRQLRPCWECWENKVRTKQLVQKCKYCEHKFMCLTNAE